MADLDAEDKSANWIEGYADALDLDVRTGRTHAGVTAWKSSGADLRDYERQETQ